MGSPPAARPPASIVECASRLFGLSGLLRSSWRRLPARDRDVLLAELVSIAATLRNALELSEPRLDGPTSDDVRAQLKGPTSRVYLQPVVALATEEVVGFEALTRFAAWTPDRWFRRAWESGIGLEFELNAVTRVVPVISRLVDEVYLAVNVSPLTLISTELLKLIEAAGPQRIVLELTEHESITEYDLYRRQLRRLRKLGVRIAVDDAGAGHASLQHIIQLGPDIVKLDRVLTANCDTDPVRKSLLTCLATFASETDTALVAEGVETAAEARALISFGVVFGQGYHFGRPEQEPRLAASHESGGRLARPATAESGEANPQVL